MYIKSILRISVLLALFAVGMFGVFSEPLDDSQTWMLDLIISKGIGFAAFFFAARCYRKWSKTDPWLKAYDKACNESLDTPNPMKID